MIRINNIRVTDIDTTNNKTIIFNLSYPPYYNRIVRYIIKSLDTYIRCKHNEK